MYIVLGSNNFLLCLLLPRYARKLVHQQCKHSWHTNFCFFLCCRRSLAATGSIQFYGVCETVVSLLKFCCTRVESSYIVRHTWSYFYCSCRHRVQVVKLSEWEPLSLINTHWQGKAAFFGCLSFSCCSICAVIFLERCPESHRHQSPSTEVILREVACSQSSFVHQRMFFCDDRIRWSRIPRSIRLPSSTGETTFLMPTRCFLPA